MRDMTGGWLFPPLDKLMMAVGLEEVGTYTLCRQNTATQYIATRLILDIYLVVESWTGARVTMI